MSFLAVKAAWFLFALLYSARILCKRYVHRWQSPISFFRLKGSIHSSFHFSTVVIRQEQVLMLKLNFFGKKIRSFRCLAKNLWWLVLLAPTSLPPWHSEVSTLELACVRREHLSRKCTGAQKCLSYLWIGSSRGQLALPLNIVPWTANCFEDQPSWQGEDNMCMFRNTATFSVFLLPHTSALGKISYAVVFNFIASMNGLNRMHPDGPLALLCSTFCWVGELINPLTSGAFCVSDVQDSLESSVKSHSCLQRFILFQISEWIRNG